MNVLHIWHIRAIPTYRIYRLYDYCYNFLKLKVHVQVYGLLRVVLISTEICVGNFNSSSKFCYSTYVTFHD